ncbi:MAG: GGDEF domain-containing protein [Arcobacteraceae bacterium]
MSNLKLLFSSKVKMILSFIVSCILFFLLYETIYLEQKIEENMFEISTSDVLSITRNNAKSIKKLLKNSNNYIDDIKNDLSLQKNIEDKLKLLITNNIKYAYLLYKDKNNTFRFLADASNPKEKALVNQKFDVESQDWFDLYVDKKERLIKHELLKTLSISFIVPIKNNDSVELLLVIDFSLNKVKNINSVINLMQNGIITILLILILFLSVLVFQLIKYNKVKKSAFIDKLTNVYNRNYLQEKQDEIDLSQYILAVIDIDHFKKINDTYGHSVGDIILKETASIMLNTIRGVNDDIIIRYGGEEFLVLIKKTDGHGNRVSNVFERILKNIENYKFRISETKYVNITVSIGVNLNPSKSRNFTDAFKVADAVLYTAKESGRNNIKTVK